MRGTHLAAWCLAAMLALGAGCGYRMLGKGPAFGVTRICIMPFAEAAPAGMSADLAHDLTTALTAEGLQIVTSPKDAQGVFTGTVDVHHVPGTTLQAVQMYTVDVLVSATLWGEGPEPLWQGTLSLQEDFLPTPPGDDAQPLVTERRRRVALRRVSERIAAQLTQALRMAADGFEAPPKS